MLYRQNFSHWTAVRINIIYRFIYFLFSYKKLGQSDSCIEHDQCIPIFKSQKFTCNISLTNETNESKKARCGDWKLVYQVINWSQYALKKCVWGVCKNNDASKCFYKKIIQISNSGTSSADSYLLSEKV